MFSNSEKFPGILASFNYNSFSVFQIWMVRDYCNRHFASIFCTERQNRLYCDLRFFGVIKNSIVMFKYFPILGMTQSLSADTHVVK